MIKDILETFLDENIDAIVTEVEEIEEEEAPIPDVSDKCFTLLDTASVSPAFWIVLVVTLFLMLFAERYSRIRTE
ncbi:hypothetical protein HF086_011112 [Spodoptera exigua]|uniref:Uncharacterized protein n=1 Tax=Spodoptera exigua TaxID=7107 RepID=A0A922SRY1_SPOEX|nr:hypothetical protein HF086_011112 [Spodoptera exigua]